MEKVVAMAVLYPIKCIDRDDDFVVLELSKATDHGYLVLGKVCVDLVTNEIELTETFDADAERVFVPVRWAIERQLRDGQIPDEFAYAA